MLILFMGCNEMSALDENPNQPDVFSVQSNDFVNTGVLPAQFLHALPGQCSGDNDFPHLSWLNAPEGTTSFVIIVEDLSAQQGTGENWVHLNLYNIPSSVTGFEALESVSTGVFMEVSFPEGAVGDNSWLGNSGIPNGWGGPCPPFGMHVYSFGVFAMSTTLPSPLNNVSISEFEAAHSQDILGFTSISSIVLVTQ
ncbi:MAG: YbhB/YbcL family Raf kinase inhibitor-like protein [Bdellovibrionales bacterium]